MNQVSFEEIGAVTATFLAKEDVVPGQVVKITDDGQVGACSDNDAFCGLALSNRKGFAGVQVKGFMTLPTGVTALVVSVDDAAHTAVVCL